jgi:hypothetical protein
MIRNLDLKCPYCGACVHALDMETMAVVMNPDGADQAPCDHFVHAYYMGLEDSFQGIHPAFDEPDGDAECFLTEAVLGGTFDDFTPSTEHKFEDVTCEFFGDKRLGPFDALFLEEDEDDEDEDVWNDEPSDSSEPEPCFEKAKEILEYDAEDDDSPPPAPKPSYEQVKCFVLWSKFPEDLARETRFLWRPNGTVGPTKAQT